MDVLIVEDDPAVRKSHAKILERAGFMVASVDNGLAAFAELQQRPFRVIVCDIKMPFLEGKSLYEQLEENMPDMAGRVVFVTSWVGDEPTRRFLERTGQPFLEKPVELAELVDVVRKTAAKPG